MSPLEIYQSDIALEKEITDILQNRSLRKKEKIKLLRALQDSSCNAHLKSHVQYYLNQFSLEPFEIMLTVLSASFIITFVLNTVIRLIEIL